MSQHVLLNSDLCAEFLIIIQFLAQPSKVIYTKYAKQSDAICCAEPCGAVQHVDLHVVCHVNDGWLHTPQGKTCPEAAHDERRDKRGDWEPVIQYV